MTTKQYHRIRFYQGRWSNFDAVEGCKKPGFCVGCEFKHPFCTETGRVEATASTEPTQAAPEASPRRAQ